MLHYNPPQVSSINMPIFRRTNCIITAYGNVTVCKRLSSVPDEIRMTGLRPPAVGSHPAQWTAVYRK